MKIMKISQRNISKAVASVDLKHKNVKQNAAYLQHPELFNVIVALLNSV